MTIFILTNPAKRGISFSLALSAYNIEIRNNIKTQISNFWKKDFWFKILVIWNRFKFRNSKLEFTMPYSVP